MAHKSLKKIRRLKIRYRIRKQVIGSLARPRFSVYKSNTALYAQFINDVKGHTMLAADTRKLKGNPLGKATAMGAILAEEAKKQGISNVVYDRSGYIFHGVVKALFESFRQKITTN